MRFYSGKNAVPINSSSPEPEADTGRGSPENFTLWDEAYDLLKAEKPELLFEYECILSRVLDEGSQQNS